MYVDRYYRTTLTYMKINVYQRAFRNWTVFLKFQEIRVGQRSQSYVHVQYCRNFPLVKVAQGWYPRLRTKTGRLPHELGQQ